MVADALKSSSVPRREDFSDPTDFDDGPPLIFTPESHPFDQCDDDTAVSSFFKWNKDSDEPTNWQEEENEALEFPDIDQEDLLFQVAQLDHHSMWPQPYQLRHQGVSQHITMDKSAPGKDLENIYSDTDVAFITDKLSYEFDDEAEVELSMTSTARRFDRSNSIQAIPLIIPCGKMQKLMDMMESGGVWESSPEERSRESMISSISAVLDRMNFTLPQSIHDAPCTLRMVKHLWILDRSALQGPLVSEEGECQAFPAHAISSILVKEGSRRYECIRLVLQHALTLLHSNTFATKRAIYYHHVTYFRSQVEVDNAVLDLIASFAVPRASFHINASAKGLVAGRIRIFLKHCGLCVDASQSGQMGLNIPSVEDVQEIRTSCTRLLVVEKEAVFRTLLSLGFVDNGEWLLVTGKGYPDLATREFVGCLTNAQSAITVILGQQSPLSGFVLVDFDVYGLEIFLTYRFGSQAMATSSNCLSSSKLKWIGVQSEDLIKLMDPSHQISMSRHDRKRVLGLLQRDYLQHTPCIRRELCRLLFYGVRAEIEGVPAAKLIQYIEERCCE